MSKIVSSCLLLTITIGLAACGSKDNGSTDNNAKWRVQFVEGDTQSSIPGVDTNTNPALYTEWKIKDKEEDGWTIKTRFSFRKGIVAVKAECISPEGESFTSQVEASANITNDELDITEDKSVSVHLVSDNDSSVCFSHLPRTIIKYSIQGDQMNFANNESFVRAN